MPPTAFVTHHDCSRHDTGWQHPEHQGRLPAVARAVYREMLTLHEVLREVEGVPADEETLLLAHSPEYVERVRAGVAAAEAAGEPVDFQSGTRLSAASWDAATAAVGCVVTAADAVLDGEVANAFCSVRPPGSGAGRERAENYAVFNSVAIAARHLRERRGVDSVLIVEWGERFGAGTAEIVGGDDGLRHLCVHAAERGGGDRVDGSRVVAPRVPERAGLTDLLQALERGAAELLAAHGPPQVVLLSLGLDVLQSDPLGTMALSPEDLAPLTDWAKQLAEQHCSGRLVSALEGGYDAPAAGAAVVHHLRALTGMRS
jgi:acetoin utilization deacetylase AcuC-like enzyme